MLYQLGAINKLNILYDITKLTSTNYIIKEMKTLINNQPNNSRTFVTTHAYETARSTRRNEVQKPSSIKTISCSSSENTLRCYLASD